MTPEIILEEVDALTQLRPRWAAWREVEKRYGRKKTYRAYLRSPEWRAKRAKKLPSVCEACGTEDACQVHHESYRYIYAEPLWDLRAVCDLCHERMTAIDNRRAHEEASR